MGTGSRTVGMAYSCNNPTSCISGQTLALKASSATTYANIAANNNGVTPISYTNVSLNFNASGEAPIDFIYSDVGQISLLGQLLLSASGNDPAITLTGSSDAFIVKPYTLRVASATQTASPFLANPGTTSAGSGFIAAGEKFSVTVRSYNALGAVTPNFGNEGGTLASSERNKIQLQIGCPERSAERDKTNVCPAIKPDHPTGGVSGVLTVGEDANLERGIFLTPDP